MGFHGAVFALYGLHSVPVCTARLHLSNLLVFLPDSFWFRDGNSPYSPLGFYLVPTMDPLKAPALKYLSLFVFIFFEEVAGSALVESLPNFASVSHREAQVAFKISSPQLSGSKPWVLSPSLKLPLPPGAYHTQVVFKAGHRF